MKKESSSKNLTIKIVNYKLIIYSLKIIIQTFSAKIKDTAPFSNKLHLLKSYLFLFLFSFSYLSLYISLSAAPKISSGVTEESGSILHTP